MSVCVRHFRVITIKMLIIIFPGWLHFVVTLWYDIKRRIYGIASTHAHRKFMQNPMVKSINGWSTIFSYRECVLTTCSFRTPRNFAFCDVRAHNENSHLNLSNALQPLNFTKINGIQNFSCLATREPCDGGEALKMEKKWHDTDNNGAREVNIGSPFAYWYKRIVRKCYA